MSKLFSELGPRGHFDARYFSGELSRADHHHVLIRMLQSLTAFVNRKGIDLILMHGALIGWSFNRKLLPWDTDIDVCVLIDDLDTLAKESMSFCLGDFFIEINPHYVHRFTLNQSFQDNGEPNKIDARIIDKVTGAFIDITALVRVEDFLATKCPHTYHYHDIFPVLRDSFEGVPICIPHKPSIVLEQEYGSQVSSPHYRDFTFDYSKQAWCRTPPSQR